MVALRDIAHSVGVSVSLVSKVLNNRLGTTGVSAETVDTVRRTAEQMGYRKNASAVALLAGRHNIVGVYIHAFGMAGSGILDALLGGISTVAHQFHQRLQLNFFSRTAEFEELCEGAHHGAVDGLVVGGVSGAVSVDRLQAIRASGLPVVTIHDHPLCRTIPNVGLNQLRVSRMATAHLIARGARRIAHIRNSEERHQGYRRALAAAKIPYDAARVFDARERDYGHAVGEQAIQSFLDRGVAFDGLVAQSDQEAMGAMNLLFRRGLKVPEDVLLIGIDNAPYCEFARVPLSSVSQNDHLRGEAAMRLVLAMIAGRRARSLWIKPELIARESSTPAPPTS